MNDSASDRSSVRLAEIAAALGSRWPGVSAPDEDPRDLLPEAFAIIGFDRALALTLDCVGDFVRDCLGDSGPGAKLLQAAAEGRKDEAGARLTEVQRDQEELSADLSAEEFNSRGSANQVCISIGEAVTQPTCNRSDLLAEAVEISTAGRYYFNIVKSGESNSPEIHDVVRSTLQKLGDHLHSFRR